MPLDMVGLGRGLAAFVIETKADRYVRTNEGAVRYGVPIGSRITAKGEVYDATGRRIGSISNRNGKMVRSPAPVVKKPAAVKPAASKKPATAKVPVKKVNRPVKVDRNGAPILRQTGGYGSQKPKVTGKPRPETIAQAARNLKWRPKVINKPRPKLVLATIKVKTTGQTWGELAREAGTSIKKLKQANGFDPNNRKSKGPAAGTELKMTTKASRAKKAASIKAIKEHDTAVRRERKILAKKKQEYSKNTWSGVKVGVDSNGRKVRYMTFDRDRIGSPDSQPKAVMWQEGGKWKWSIGIRKGESVTASGAARQIAPYLPESGLRAAHREQEGWGPRTAQRSPYTLTAKEKATKKAAETRKRKAEQTAKDKAAKAKADAKAKAKAATAAAAAKEKARQAAIARVSGRGGRRIGPKKLRVVY